MTLIKNRFGLILLISVGMSALLCFSLKPSRLENCLESYAKDLAVQPNRVDVTTKIYNTIIPQLSSNMTAVEVHQAFNEVVPTKFYNQGKTVEGGYEEMAFLNICQSVALDTILIDYSEDGFYVRARLYFGD